MGEAVTEHRVPSETALTHDFKPKRRVVTEAYCQECGLERARHRHEFKSTNLVRWIDGRLELDVCVCGMPHRAAVHL
jgi:hypothetical protein